MKRPFFSVIVPVYNVEHYLNQCIDSVLAQDFSDYELILVDDGSTDSSSLICDEYVKTNSHIKVLHKENGGLSDARNFGINIAEGNYLWFLDSDDYLLVNSAFRIIAEILQNKNTDVVFFSYKKYYENNGKYSRSIIKHTSCNKNIEEYIRENAYKALGCNKVVSRHLVINHQISFPKGYIGEDLIWCAELLKYSNTFIYCNQDLMAYRQRKGSITGNTNVNFRRRHIKDELYLINKTCEKFHINLSEDNNNKLIAHYLAYELSWLIGEVFPFWYDYEEDIQKLSFLLAFNLNKKVRIVSLFERVLGLKKTSLILYIFIKMKKGKAG